MPVGAQIAQRKVAGRVRSPKDRADVCAITYVILIG